MKRVDRLSIDAINFAMDARDRELTAKLTVKDSGWQDFNPIRSADWTAGTLRVARWRLLGNTMSVKLHERAFTVAGAPAYVSFRIPQQVVAAAECFAAAQVADTLDAPLVNDASLAIALSGGSYVRVYRSADLVSTFDADAGVNSVAFTIDIEVIA